MRGSFTSPARILRLAEIGAVACLGLAPVPAHAVDLTSEGGFRWDIQDSGGGELLDGTSDAYDGAMYLDVNGTMYRAAGASRTTLDGRNVILAEAVLGMFRVHRQVYVPRTGGDYARYLEVVVNTSSSPQTLSLRIYGNLGSDGATVLHATSSADTSFTSTDLWFATDDTDGSGDPSMAHVLQGTSPRVGASEASLSADNFSWTFRTTVPAGGRVCFLSFAIQARDRATSLAAARRLAEGPDDALVGLDEFFDDIVNFGLSRPGAPRIRFDGPFDMDEGAEATIRVTVEDPEGTPVTWSWDLDADGTFGEMPGATSYTIPAGSTDGPGVVRLGIRASDGTNTIERYRTVNVRNVAPRITSSPPLTTSVGALYRYELRVEEPAGARDALTFTVVRGPRGMVVSSAGVVQWTPREVDVTPPGRGIEVEIGVADGDEGSDSQSWSLAVSPNRAPSQPVPIYPVGVLIADRRPRFVIANAEDPDGDALRYEFEVDRVDTFDSPDKVASGLVDETPGATHFQVPGVLPVGRLHWRVRVTDGAAVNDWVVSSFSIAGGEQPRDAGTGDGASTDAPTPTTDGSTPTRRVRERGGCSCRLAPDEGARRAVLPWFVLLAVALAVPTARRRSLGRPHTS
ncbi:MAG: hypothetical protein NZ898_05115 [Myxococcota bacterium]|nr:hypothetical protein [Myxococcota bacterium]MDW8362315.1 hypothetical protein [Myxococcales bacterium]